MILEEQINCYCFNRRCKSSIFYNETCVVTKITLSDALNNEPVCKTCSEVLISRPLLTITRDLKELKVPKKGYRSILIDKDKNYYLAVNELFQSSDHFDPPQHLASGNQAIKYLLDVKNNRELIPEFIFLGLSNTDNTEWEFLQLFELISSQLQKQVWIYIITDNNDPVFKKRFGVLRHVRGLLTQNFDVESLNNIVY